MATKDTVRAYHAGQVARHGDQLALAAALRASRADTLATFDTYAHALPALSVPLREELNLPLWELGHVGWFQEYWLARNAQRGRGAAAESDLARPEGVRAGADALYHSGLGAHEARWSLPLPDAQATLADLTLQLEQTLALLADTPDEADALYFYRLVLLHEDMHHEAALYMAQSLGIAITDPRWQVAALPGPCAALKLSAGRWVLGQKHAAGFAFDNELGTQEVPLGAYAIDDTVVRWAQYLPFVEAGGYRNPTWWSEAGQRWLAATQAQAPRYLRHVDTVWQQWRHGHWVTLDRDLPACHLSFFEAQAWCAWAGRRLPTEAQWERAALEHPDAFRWGDVWEWTASAFAPYPGFKAHPYRDYSLPWFDGRPVLRGASFATQPRLRHPRYRNFFPADRNDIFAGFRSCAV